MWGLLILILGVILLLRDLNVWAFWDIQPWTLVFLTIGLAMVMTGICKCHEAPKRKK